MATVADVARDLLGSMASDASMPVAVKWIDNRYQEMVSKVKFRHLRRLGTIILPASISTGSVAVTLGSTSVTGTDTTWNVAPGVIVSGAEPYWALRADSVWHDIDEISDLSTLVLSDQYSETTNTEAGYHIVKRYQALASGARWLGKFVLPSFQLDLGEPVPRDELDSLDPQRIMVGGYPTMVAQVHNSPDNYLMVEIYPYPTDVMMVNYVYWDIPSTLGVESTIPPQIDGYTLKEGAYVDFCRMMQAIREKEGKIESAAFWRNEYRAAETRWFTIMKDASRTDRGVDDLQFVLERSSYRGRNVDYGLYKRDLTISS